MFVSDAVEPCAAALPAAAAAAAALPAAAAAALPAVAAAVSKAEIGRGFNQRPSSALACSISTTDSS